jgi:Ca2+-binding RTX toxin-like protein
MSFVISDTSTVFGAGQSGTTFAATPAPAPQTNQIVLTGSNNRLDLGKGAAEVQVLGGGNIVESVKGSPATSAKVIDLGSPASASNGAKVDTTSLVGGNAVGSTATIATAAGNQGGEFDYYAHGGSGNDLMNGSAGNDFIRGGAGNDTINAFAGNDVIRGGSGADRMTLGQGSDTAYYTSDQLDGKTDTITDFDSGVDKIAIEVAGITSTSQISGLGTNTITLAAGSKKVRIVSQSEAFQAGDINFI